MAAEPKWEDWLASRPPKVRDVARRFPPDTCYRCTEDRGHYAIYSYEETGAGPVTVKLIHGADSFLPFVRVFGVDPETLLKCGCGNWASFDALAETCIEPASSSDDD